MDSRRTNETLPGMKIPAAVLIALFALSACAAGRVPFTQDLRDQYGLERDDLKKLQYFISGDVTLQREFLREEGEVSKTHKLVIKEGGHVEEVFIAAGTPGIATEIGPASLAVSFEPGGSLVFGSPSSDRDSGTEIQAFGQAVDRLLRGDPLRQQDLVRREGERPGLPRGRHGIARRGGKEEEGASGGETPDEVAGTVAHFPPARYSGDIPARLEAEHAATGSSRGHRSGLRRSLRDGTPGRGPGRRIPGWTAGRTNVRRMRLRPDRLSSEGRHLRRPEGRRPGGRGWGGAGV